ALAFVVLLVPTSLMGATLPLAVRGLRNLQQEVNPTSRDAWTMGLLYATNTAGAIFGCLLSGFILIGGPGLTETITTAAAANSIAGIGALIFDRYVGRGTRHAVTARPVKSQLATRTGNPALARTAVIAFALSGAIS